MSTGLTQRAQAPVVHRGLRACVAPLALGAGALAGAALLAVRSPYVPLSYGICPSVALLGVVCPGCGGLRATHDLVTGDLVAAWHANPLWVVAVPVLVVAWSVWLVRRWRGEPARTRATWPAWVLIAVVVVFTVLRNVPALAPSLGPPPLL